MWGRAFQVHTIDLVLSGRVAICGGGASKYLQWSWFCLGVLLYVGAGLPSTYNRFGFVWACCYMWGLAFQVHTIDLVLSGRVAICGGGPSKYIQ